MPDARRICWHSLKLVGLSAALALLASSQVRAAGVWAWGDNTLGQTAVPADLTDVVAIAAGGGHNVALKTDGTVAVWGYSAYGQLNVPAGLNNVVKISAGYDHSLALRSNGTVVAWGRSSEGQTTVPAGLANVVAVSANEYHSLALQTNGTVVAWGNNIPYGQGSVPPGLGSVKAIAAGTWHNLALLNDGTIVGWGRSDSGQIAIPSGLTDVVAIAAGEEFSLALKSDGTVVAWGRNQYGQTDVPAGLSGVVAIAAGAGHGMALKADATVVAWGWNNNGQATVPTTLANVGAISAGYWHSLALLKPNNDQPPTITCPSDVVLQCANCNTDPSHTGMATATDDGSVGVTFRDSEGGVCPKVVTRTWTATDDHGQTASCVQTITCMPSSLVSLVTDSSWCVFDRDPATPVQDFRLIFTQDPQNWPCYRLTASNPGQFLYNVFYTGTPGQEVSLDLTLPYPFVTQGANPIHAYDWVAIITSGEQQCLLPGNAFFVNSQEVKLSNYGNPPQASTTVSVKLSVPDSGVVFLSVHLDYGLKGQTGYTRNAAGDAVDCATGARVLVPNNGSSEFSVSGAANDTTSIQNINVFKKNPGIAGVVLQRTSAEPVPGTTVTLTTAKGTLIASRLTDEDGFYAIVFKHKGKAATYYVSIVTPSGHTQKKAVTIKANGYVTVDFSVP
jgi:alpha-tubulin suppressor-like RCC1 family protein